MCWFLCYLDQTVNGCDKVNFATQGVTFVIVLPIWTYYIINMNNNN